MAALAPPPNIAGVPLPAPPANPASLADITNAKEYIDRLSLNKYSGVPNAATVNNIGQAEAYRTAVIFSHSPGGNAAPPWLANLTANVANLTANVQQIANSTQQNTANLANLTANVQQITNNLALLQQKMTELPIILSNSQAGPRGPLYNPTLMPGQGWAPLLGVPNPRTRDELLAFTAQQCTASALSLGLPILPQQTTVHERRRQIAIRIGVTIE